MKKLLLILSISCVAFSYTPNNGRVLAAANCFQCHGTNGVSVTNWDSIKDEDVEDFYDDHPIMYAQTFGFNRNEVREIFNYLHSIKSGYYKSEYRDKEKYYNKNRDSYYDKEKYEDYEYKNKRYDDEYKYKNGRYYDEYKNKNYHDDD
ncbi:hypothetical protein FE773_02510 [Caminibacter mediatlanticus TB-2]|uniref:Cytochrome c n=1 Tax=Caminibacter mediatlanticus TB-2 TaxID=391592 RepID=A0ABX5V733_9BACT|nr:cytochrome c [Caminibacter mediatlanticus]QCT94085.1 hypothetical protein FE773_02510 [Caminibacter mediatlanticus TB-2]